MWHRAAAGRGGGLISQLASNNLSNSCSKDTAASCWLLSPPPLFRWGAVVPRCGGMSEEATELEKTIINIWQSLLNLQGPFEVKRRKMRNKRKWVVGGGGGVSLSFGEAAGVWKEDINKVWVKSHGPLMPSLYAENGWQFASSCLDIPKWVNALPCSVPTHASQKRILRVTRNACTPPKKGKTKGRESETEIRIGNAGNEE